MENKDRVYVLGHKNPDTDSICSAIAYAYLKNQKGEGYIAGRCGALNNETKFVLEYFGAETPEYIENVRTQIKDIEIRQPEGVNSLISLKTAWEIMKERNVVTLAIVNEENKLEGLITVSDIAKSYMDVYDNKIVATAKTPYKNLVEILNGEMLVGDINQTITKGKIFIAAANPEMMEDYIADGDIVICGDRFESQLCAVEMKAQCIIICCENSRVSKTIKKIAGENGCNVIRTNYDTYTATRLVNQSMPIKYFMRTHDLITFAKTDYLDEIRSIMAQKRHRDFPVLSKSGKLEGMISRRNLIGGRSKRVILVDHNEKCHAVEGLEQAEVLEVIDHHRIADFETVNPIFFRNQPLGCTATIITQMYKEQGVEIPKREAGLLCAAIISDTLIFSSPTCTYQDRHTAEELSKIAGIETEDFAKKMFSAGSSLKNKTVDQIFYQDFKMFSAGEISFGVGQFNLMDNDEIEALKGKIYNYMIEENEQHGTDMMFFLLTNIIEKSSVAVFCGENSAEYITRAFRSPDTDFSVTLKGVVSRKKQFIPALINAIHTEAN
ncbi:MAG: putative manganese-dependent inorganic diphosphatase [Clostridiales bacterium]|nr:putative manganese-dependent inorganic diphosphatase [Clostridiales bacterium]